MNKKFIAVQPLTWGDGTINPGEPVPLEEGRDYGALERHGFITAVPEAPEGNASTGSDAGTVTIVIRPQDDVIVRVEANDAISFVGAEFVKRHGKKAIVRFHLEGGELSDETPVKLKDVFEGGAGEVIADLQAQIAALQADLEAATNPGTPLPDGFPGKKALEAAGLTSLEAVSAKTEQELVDVDGIGAATAAKILEALQAATG
jgi:hypothetical protein